jgi:flagellar protein FliO/FliZ
MLNGTLIPPAPKSPFNRLRKGAGMDLFDTGRYLAGLFFTLGLIFGLWYLLRRYAPGMVRGAPVSNEKTLFVKEILQLDPRRRVVVVNSGEREHILLLGLTGDMLIESRDTVPDAPNISKTEATS